ncbi:unnamed protein product, partial [Aphanomyces euteiches]
ESLAADDAAAADFGDAGHGFQLARADGGAAVAANLAAPREDVEFGRALGHAFVESERFLTAFHDGAIEFLVAIADKDAWIVLGMGGGALVGGQAAAGVDHVACIGGVVKVGEGTRGFGEAVVDGRGCQVGGGVVRRVEAKAGDVDPPEAVRRRRQGGREEDWDKTCQAHGEFVNA